MTSSGFLKVRSEDAPASIAVSYGPMVTELRSVFNSGKTKDLAWRRSQLAAFKKLVEENHEDITAALRADLGGPKMRGIAEMSMHSEAELALKNLDQWTSPEAVPTPMQVSPTMMGKSFIRNEPKGVVLIIGPWNFPYECTLKPMVHAIAAGNCVVIKPSEISANCAAHMESLINKYLDTSCIKVVQGGVPETTALLKEQWDHIFYTGNGAVGRIILKAASEHLTTCTLELGGKSPVIIDKTANMKSAIERVSRIKWLNAGQICIAPDYVLVDKDREQEFIDGMKKEIGIMFGQDPKADPNFGRMISTNHVSRVSALLKETKGQVVAGGMEGVDPASKYIPPTLVRNATLGEPLLSEEIFGPVLPVVPVNSVDDAINKANSICDKPLALYVFSEDAVATEHVLTSCQSGGAAVNTCLEHVTNIGLPFGGVGGSGHGSYHGKAGFDAFTHRRSVLKQDTTIMKGAAIPPKPNEQMYDMAVKMIVTGFLTEGQRKVLGVGVKAGAVAAAGLLLRSRL